VPYGACSVANRTAPPHSPPRLKPCIKPQDYQQDRRGDPYGSVSRQQAYQHRGDAHHQQREDEHRFAPDPIAEVTEDGSTQRPCHERHREGCECSQRAGGGGELGEEDAT